MLQLDLDKGLVRVVRGHRMAVARARGSTVNFDNTNTVPQRHQHTVSPAQGVFLLADIAHEHGGHAQPEMARADMAGEVGWLWVDDGRMAVSEHRERKHHAARAILRTTPAPSAAKSSLNC